MAEIVCWVGKAEMADTGWAEAEKGPEGGKKRAGLWGSTRIRGKPQATDLVTRCAGLSCPNKEVVRR